MSFNLATMLRESATANPDKPLAHVGDLSFTCRQRAAQGPDRQDPEEGAAHVS
jgi:hypothetical protein